MSDVSRLLSISSKPLAAPPADLDREFLRRHATLLDLLTQRNGFFAFEAALHVIPVGIGVRAAVELSEWNFGVDSWRRAYHLQEDLLAFAQDVLGVQFLASSTGEVLTLEPETGTLTPFAEDVNGWAQALLADYRQPTAWLLAHNWQVEHGPLPVGWRLMPIVPFVLGGEFDIKNLAAAPAQEVLAQHATVYGTIKDKPDGATITWPLS